MKNLQQGQSFVEVIVVVAVLALVLTGLITATTASLKTTTFANLRSQSTKYAQEGIELARSKRDASWNTFLALQGQSFCVDDASPQNWLAGANCAYNISNNTFNRKISFVWDGTKMTVSVNVGWVDSGGNHHTQLETYLTQWR